MKDGIIDNRRVNDNHQEGIKRVIQRKSEHGPCAQSGKMGHANRSDAGFKRSGASLTPRKA